MDGFTAFSIIQVMKDGERVNTKGSEPWSTVQVR